MRSLGVLGCSRQVSLSVWCLYGGGEGYSGRRASTLGWFSTFHFSSSQVPRGSQGPTPGGPCHPQSVCQLQCPPTGHQESAYRGKCSSGLCIRPVSGPRPCLSDPRAVSYSSSNHPGLAFPGQSSGCMGGALGWKRREGDRREPSVTCRAQVSLASRQLGLPLGPFLGLVRTPD